MFRDAHPARMQKIMRAVCADLAAEPVEVNGKHNHVDLLVDVPPKAALPKLVNSLKGVSSRRMRQDFPYPTMALPPGQQAPVGPTTSQARTKAHR